MDTKIISYEDYIKQNKKSDITKAVSEYNELKAKRDYIETKRASDEAQKQIKTAIRQEQSRLGVKTPTLAPLATTNNTSVLDNDTGRLKLQSAYETNQQNIAKYTEQQKKNNELTQNSPVINQLNNLSKEVNNQKLIAKYNYDIAKEANHEINTWDKTGGVVTRAVSDFFNPEKLDSSNYFEQNGNRMVLPTASAIRQQNVSASYDENTVSGKLAKIVTDAGYNLTKIGLSRAINTIVPYGGSALYYADMAADSFNQNKLDGYDDASSAMSSVLGVASEMITEKILGGFSNLMGGESKLSSTVNKVLSKIMKNDRLRSIISNAFSEGAEEFTQEYIERLNKNLILDKNNWQDTKNNTFNWDTFGDAMYSAIVGAVSGGAMGGIDVEINTNNTGVIPKVVDGKVDVKTYVNDLENAKANTNNQQKINNINEVLSSIDVANNVNDVYSTFGEKLLNGEIDQKLSQQNTKAETVSENNDNINILPRAKKNNAIDHYVVNEAINNGEIQLKGNNILRANQNVENNSEKYYNKSDLDYIALVSSNPDIESYANYSMLKEWLNKPVSELKRVSRMISEDSIIKKNQGLQESKYNDVDGKTVYSYKILNNEYNYSIDSIYEYNSSMEDVYGTEYGTNVGEVGKIVKENESNRQRFEFNSDVMLSNKGQSQQNDSISRKQYQEWFDRKRDNKRSNRNTRQELDSSSFSLSKNLKGNNVLRANNENISSGTSIPTDVMILSENQKYNRNNGLSQLNDMTQYVDDNNHIFAIPDNLAMNLTEKTNITSNMIGELESILKNAKETKINGDNIEVKSDYWDNSTIDIKATKQGNTYVIDDIKKIAKNQDNIVGKNGSVNYNNESKSDIKNELSNDDVIRIDNETNNNKTKNIRDSYNDTVNNATNLKESKFYKNVTETSKFINEENRIKLGKIGDIQFYEGISNEESLSKASKKLQQGGEIEAKTWLNKDVKTSDSIDVAEGWILLENYQQQGNYDAMVEVAKKMREMGTKAGQAVQAYNIMARLTPEGMVKYAQSELGEAYEIYAKNKSKSWIDENASNFDLTPQEVSFIVDTMKQVQKMEDGRNKNVKLAEINKMLTDKLPPEKGSGIKAWMRTSMLFNPKTQIRNILGNAVITPVNMVGDFFASKVDKAIAKKTGVRTTGTTDAKSYLKGFKKGLFESYDDFKRGINTRDVKGNRFEIGQGKSFNDNTKIGKALNRVDSLNSFLLDFGDRGFYEAAFTNSINNQLALNNKTTVTQEMVDIATSEALSRTWQDNNNYTKFVLQTRNGLNKINVKGYGLGDILIPFAKTPANLTKAIVDYSPAGLVKVLIEGRNLKNNISTGKNTAMEQHQFVQDLGKSTAGTMLYIGAYALAKAGIATGNSDEDKDTRDFIKNTLGVNSYSIKIGGKSFTYDWAQPVAAPLSIMTNIVNSKNNKGQALLEAITGSLDSAGSILLEQSFLKSINEVLTDNDGIVSGIENAILDLPARAVPTFMKQIVDLTDSTQRQTFEYGQPLKTAKNKIIAKIPGLNQTLTPSVDSMGREIQKYGGKNNIFNVFLNPANVNTENISEGAKEIYRVYKEVGDNSIMPRVAPYYINSKGEKTILNTDQRKDFQKIAGKLIEDSVNELKTNNNYKNMSDTDKSDAIKDVVDYAYNKARKDVLGIELANKYNKITEWLEKGGTVASYYANQKEVNYSLQNPERYNTIKNFGVNYYDYEVYQKKVSEIKKQYEGTQNQKVRKQKIFDYINSLNLNKNKKIILFKMLGNYSIKDYSSSIANYIESFELSAKEKQEIWNTLF